MMKFYSCVGQLQDNILATRHLLEFGYSFKHCAVVSLIILLFIRIDYALQLQSY